MAKPKILLVEDSMPSQLASKIILEKLGCVVTCANNGIEAVASAGNAEFDLIFMDVNMPELNGIDAIKEIRTKPGPNSETFVIALSGLEKDKVEKQLIEYTNTYVITKPVTKACFQDVLTRFS